jgi:hypothetical protein
MGGRRRSPITTSGGVVMPWLQVFLFFMKYGLGILQLVKAIWELADWVKTRDQTLTVSGKMMRQNLNVMASNAKKSGCKAELEKMRDVLAKRKAELERGQ